MYVDPGTGNIIIQVLVGVAVAIPVFLKLFWTKIKGFWSKRSGKAT